MSSATSLRPVAPVLAGDDARLVLQIFFDEDYGLAHASKLLHKYLRSAFARKSRLNKLDMLNMHYFIDVLGNLIAAAEVLATGPEDRKSSAIIPPSAEYDLLNPSLYYDGQQQGDPIWDHLPRHLSRAEYINPYRALDKCFTRKNSTEWKAFLIGLYYAGSKDNNNVSEDSRDEDIYQSCRGLFRLLEACHLIKVRGMKRREPAIGLAG